VLAATDDLALVAHEILAREATGRVLGRTVPYLRLAASRGHLTGHITFTTSKQAKRNLSHFYILVKEKSAMRLLLCTVHATQLLRNLND